MSSWLSSDPDAGPAQFGELEHITVVGDGRRSTCTMFPRGCSDEELATRWITAEGESFVALDQIE